MSHLSNNSFYFLYSGLFGQFLVSIFVYMDGTWSTISSSIFLVKRVVVKDIIEKEDIYVYIDLYMFILSVINVKDMGSLSLSSCVFLLTLDCIEVPWSDMLCRIEGHGPKKRCRCWRNLSCKKTKSLVNKEKEDGGREPQLLCLIKEWCNIIIWACLK